MPNTFPISDLLASDGAMKIYPAGLTTRPGLPPTTPIKIHPMPMVMPKMPSVSAVSGTAMTKEPFGQVRISTYKKGTGLDSMLFMT